VIADVSHALSRLEGEDVSDRNLDVDAAFTTTSVCVEKRNYLVPCIDESAALGAEC
jgi:hypothetical protein